MGDDLTFGDRVRVNGYDYEISDMPAPEIDRVGSGTLFLVPTIPPACSACGLHPAGDVEIAGARFCNPCVERAMIVLAIAEACEHLRTHDPALVAVYEADNVAMIDARSRSEQYIELQSATHDAYRGEHSTVVNDAVAKVLPGLISTITGS